MLHSLTAQKSDTRSLYLRAAESTRQHCYVTRFRRALCRSLSLWITGSQAAEAEGAAVEEICSSLRIPWRSVRYRGSRFGVGEIRGRNALLLHMALVEFPSNSGVVELGIHAGTGYADCSPEFMEAIERSYEFHTGGAITATAPFLHWTKQEVYRLATELGIPFAQTHSCEASNLPCGQCRSCQDRSLLVNGPFAC